MQVDFPSAHISVCCCNILEPQHPPGLQKSIQCQGSVNTVNGPFYYKAHSPVTHTFIQCFHLCISTFSPWMHEGQRRLCIFHTHGLQELGIDWLWLQNLRVNIHPIIHLLPLNEFRVVRVFTGRTSKLQWVECSVKQQCKPPHYRGSLRQYVFYGISLFKKFHPSIHLDRLNHISWMRPLIRVIDRVMPQL